VKSFETWKWASARVLFRTRRASFDRGPSQVRKCLKTMKKVLENRFQGKLQKLGLTGPGQHRAIDLSALSRHCVGGCQGLAISFVRSPMHRLYSW